MNFPVEDITHYPTSTQSDNLRKFNKDFQVKEEELNEENIDINVNQMTLEQIIKYLKSNKKYESRLNNRIIEYLEELRLNRKRVDKVESIE